MNDVGNVTTDTAQNWEKEPLADIHKAQDVEDTVYNVVVSEISMFPENTGASTSDAGISCESKSLQTDRKVDSTSSHLSEEIYTNNSQSKCEEPEAVDQVKSSEENEVKERVFKIILEDEFPPNRNDGSNGDQIFYLPLAIGTSAMRADADGPDFAAITGLSSKKGSDTLLQELGRSIFYASGSGQVLDDKMSPGDSDPVNMSLTSSFLGPKSTLLTESLIREGNVPESITKQFNEIAKLSKNSLRSKRTVRTTTTRILPSTIVSTPMLTASGSLSGTDSSPLVDRPDEPGSNHSAASPPTSKEFSQVPHTPPVHIQADAKPFHARFYSDETTHMTNFSTRSPVTSDLKRNDESPLTCSSGSSIFVPRQPAVYVRSVTAERLPVFPRNSAGVLRSKSAAGTLPHDRQHTSSLTGVPKPNALAGPILTPRSLPESTAPSHCHSAGQTTSNGSSTGSLPSLSMGVSVGDTLEVSVDNATFSPTGSDPSLSIQSPTIEPSATSTNQEATSDHSSPTKLTDRKPCDKYVTLLKRRHIMKELIHVEKDYVGALATLVNAYMIPLRQEKILDEQQIETIFYKINELFNYHMSFLNTLQMWESTNTVGDKLLDMFSREAVTYCYCAFAENFPNSERTLETCWNTKSSFQRFCEQRLRTLRSKLPLKALLVQPIQRIPRYELLVNRLIEHTPKDYSDSALLNEAKCAIHRLAVRVNTVSADGQDESALDGLRLLERLLAPATLAPNRAYIRHDMVSLEDRRDPVCIFMFTDQIVFTIAKRRGSQVMKKALFLRLQSPKGVDTIENIKYKIFHRLGIELIDLEPSGEGDPERLVQHRELRDKKDLALLAEIENISNKLDYRHHDLDAVVRRLYQTVQQELEDLRNARNATTLTPKNLSVFTATTKEGVERYELTFPSPEKRNDWERTVMELKRQLSSVKRTSRFYFALDIPRTLSGVQLSCAAVVEEFSLRAFGPRDVWICAADGYTGYVCMLTLHPKPNIYLNTPLSGCNSRITCVCAVPGCPIPSSRRSSGVSGFNGSQHHSNISRTQARRRSTLQVQTEEPLESEIETDSPQARKSDIQVSSETDSEVSKDLTTTSEVSTSSDGHSMPCEPTVSQSQIRDSLISLNSTPNTPTLAESIDKFKSFSTALDIPVVTAESKPTMNAETESALTESALESMGSLAFQSTIESDHPNSDNSDSSDGSDGEPCIPTVTVDSSALTSAEPEDTSEGCTGISVTESPRSPRPQRLLDPHRGTMWLGTEEGSIFIFYASDNVKTSRQRQRISLPSAVNSILHLDANIFVACANGDLLVYDRNSDGLWNADLPKQLNIQPENGDGLVVVRRMLAVAGNIWCAAHRFIYVINSITLKVELSFPLNGNPADPRGIQQMAYGNQTVWLAPENSPRLSLYHATTGEFLMEIDLKPVVLQTLQHCDEIIMRHKEACLKITCLTVCKDLLWVGTSAGIIVTVAIPRVTLNSTGRNMDVPQLEVLKQGHMGHVRFLVCLESATEIEKPPTSGKPIMGFSPMPEALQKTTQITSPSIGPSVSEQKDDENQISQIEDSTSKTKEQSMEADLPRTDQSSPLKGTERDSTSDLHTPLPTHQPRHCLLGVRRVSVNPCAAIATQMRVISGGDGYEEYFSDGRLNSPAEQASFTQPGDTDNLNHVLIWDVH